VPPAPAAALAASSGGPGAYVQVSSRGSEADAQASFRQLQAKFPSQLGGQSATIRRADLGDKGVFFRAMVGPYTSAEQATTMCVNLKAAGGQCVVQRN
jgi:cell division protein FtsN